MIEKRGDNMHIQKEPKKKLLVKTSSSSTVCKCLCKSITIRKGKQNSSCLKNILII